MLKRKLDEEEFGLIFKCYLTCHRHGFCDDNEMPFDIPEKTLFSLIKSEATDAIFFLASDKEDKKIKREIFKNNSLLIEAAIEQQDLKLVRQYCKKAFLEGYSFFYGDELFGFLEKQALPVLMEMGLKKVGEFLEEPESELSYEGWFQTSLMKLMTNGGIKV